MSQPLPTSDKTDPGSFQILEFPQNLNLKGRILGSVVPSTLCTRPFDGYAPYWDDPDWDDNQQDLQELQKTIDYLWSPNKETKSRGVKLTDVIASRAGEKRTEAQVKATKALEGYANHHYNRDLRIEAGNVELYTIDNPLRAIDKRLQTCKPWMQEVQRLVQKDRRKDPLFYIVTGVYTCKNLELGWSNESSDEKGLSAHIPVEAAAPAADLAAPLAGGVVKALQTSARIQRGKGTTSESSNKIEEEIVFALRYHELDITYGGTAPVKHPGLISKVGRLFGWKADTESAKQPRIIESVALGEAVRKVGMLTSYGSGIGEDLYWEEPKHVLPDLPDLSHTNGSTH